MFTYIQTYPQIPNVVLLAIRKNMVDTFKQQEDNSI